MTLQACFAHGTTTGHMMFHQSDSSDPNSWFCVICCNEADATCQHPISHTSYCSNTVVPGACFCPDHMPITHLMCNLLGDL
jgi:hypothetical protein